MDDHGLDFFHAVVWDKSARGNGMGWRYRRNYEFVMVAHRTSGRLSWANEDAQVPNIVRLAPPRERQHPNEKPVALVEHFMRLHTRPGDTVLDPFLGSGTSLAAAYRLGRQGVGIEISEEYCELAATRLEREIAQGRLFEPEETAPKPVQTTLEVEP
jgi:site-specific DNA-methyltransferase (adenine-specific)